MSIDQAETGNLHALLSQIGTGLDQFLKFEHEDSLHEDKNWRDTLNTSLPSKGVGIGQIIQDLNNEIIPNGSAVPKPGFTSYITTGAVTASTLASTAASIASPQRNIGGAFAFLE